MKTIAMIPARYAATRFPAKLMQTVGDKTIIRHTYENAVATRLFDEVIVVTDSQVIFDEIISNGGYAVMSRKQHESGSDRIAEAVENVEVDDPDVLAHLPLDRFDLDDGSGDGHRNGLVLGLPTKGELDFGSGRTAQLCRRFVQRIEDDFELRPHARLGEREPREPGTVLVCRALI